MKFNNTAIMLVCLVTLFAVVSAQSTPPTIWDTLWSVVSTITNTLTSVAATVVAAVAQTVSTYVITPALAVVSYVNDAIIAPITNTVTSTGLSFAVNTFCSSYVENQFLPSESVATALQRCTVSAQEELSKGFNFAVWNATVASTVASS